MTLRFDSSFARALPELCIPWQAAHVPAPRIVALNSDLAAELGWDAEDLNASDAVRLLVGASLPDGAQPIAQAYSGHQFGGFSPRLGDGRALLLGEVLDVHGHRRDVHLKGSGPTPFARGGDGKAALGPMLREYLMGEAMHALGIPTTRALAVIATGERIIRDGQVPGAVLVRVASSHIRVGTFQFAAAHADSALVRRLADYTITRHHLSARDAPQPYLTLLDRVVDVQASLLAEWMLVGFVHGVMNTDNMTVSGETIDYGPCAFMEAYDPATVFSSIDHGGRYAFGQQPAIAQWNLARFAETLLPFLGPDEGTAVRAATDVLESFPERFRGRWSAGIDAKLGLTGNAHGDATMASDLLTLMRAHRVDYTSGLRSLSAVLRGDDVVASPWDRAGEFGEWCDRWRAALGDVDIARVADEMDRRNPAYIPRNHLVEEALQAATANDFGPFERLLAVLRNPFDESPGRAAYAAPAPDGFGPYRTFCGT